MKSVYMICGLGSSGKSTYAKKLQKELLEKNPNKKIIICSVDEFRTCNYQDTPIEEAKALMINKVKKSFIDNDVIIVDFSFDDTEVRKWFLTLVNFPYNINFNCIYLKCTSEEIIANNYRRNSCFILNENKRKQIETLCINQRAPTKKEFNFKEVNIKVVGQKVKNN